MLDMVTPPPAAGDIIYTIDDLIRQRAADEVQLPLVAYPRSRLSATDYEHFTGQDLDRFIDGAVLNLIKAGIYPVFDPSVATLYGTSSLDYVISLLALGRLGYTTLILSHRLAVEACVNLLDKTDSSIIVHLPQLAPMVSKIREERPMKAVSLVTRNEYDQPNCQVQFRRRVDGHLENEKQVFILHSSGSTSLPKPLYFTQKRFLSVFAVASELKAFSTVPLYHTWGIFLFFQSMYKRKTMCLYNGDVPQTHDNVTAAISEVCPEIVFTVPYVLKLLAEKQDGIDVLKPCKMVAYSGSRCPDELGNLLVDQGVHIGTIFGSTENGPLLSSLIRSRDDKFWNYLRIIPHVAPYIYMKPVEDDLFECVILDGLKSKGESNSNDPPNSYHSKDLFENHPTNPDIWKYVGRLDDRVTLLNGEKVLPLPIEGRIRQEPFVKEAVVFGIDQAVPGLLVFRSSDEDAVGLSDEKYIDHIWPAVQDANTRAESFSQISREMIVLVAADRDCPTTDKSSIQRGQVYRKFAPKINEVYEKLDHGLEGELEFEIPQLERFIIEISRAQLGIGLDNADTDFFDAGMNSLKAIRLRGLLRKNLKLGPDDANTVLSPTVIFDCGNTARLAKFLYALRTCETLQQEDEILDMSAMVKKYSTFQKHIPGDSQVPDGECVLLTGATGGLGAHALYQLVTRDSIRKVYCLMRPDSRKNPLDRLLHAQEKRSLRLPSSLKDKIIALPSDFSKVNFGLDETVLEEMRNNVSFIIHSAWAVNFTLNLQSFEKNYIAGVHNLVSFSLSVKLPRPARFIFCSSVSAAMGMFGPAVVPENRLPNLEHAASTGYARSKLVSEHIIYGSTTSSNALACVLRIGQIVPSLTDPLWNPSESTPLMIRSAYVVNALPELDQQCSWLPIDTAAATILDVSGISDLGGSDIYVNDRFFVYNLVNPSTFSWATDLLPALSAAGLAFSTLPFSEWIALLKASDQDPIRNPSIKLVDYWEDQARRETRRVAQSGPENGPFVFETQRSQERSKALREASALVRDGFVEAFVGAWKKFQGV